MNFQVKHVTSQNTKKLKEKNVGWFVNKKEKRRDYFDKLDGL